MRGRAWRRVCGAGAVALLVSVGVCEGQYLLPAARPRPAAPASREPQTVDMVTFKREMAHTLADMRVLQEDIRLLVSRIEALEQERATREALIRELQERLAGYERRFQRVEQEQRAAETRLQTEMVQLAERGAQMSRQSTQQAVDGLRNAMATEVARVEQLAVRAVNQSTTAAAAAARNVPQATPTGAWVEITVQPGDTLSAIAQQAGVSVQTLIQINHLRGSVIRVGQRLKVPKVQ